MNKIFTKRESRILVIRPSPIETQSSRSPPKYIRSFDGVISDPGPCQRPSRAPSSFSFVGDAARRDFEQFSGLFVGQ